MARGGGNPTGRAAVLRASLRAEGIMGRELEKGVKRAAAAIRVAAADPDIATSAQMRADAFREVLSALAEASGRMGPELEAAIDRRCAEVAAGTARMLPRKDPPRYELTKEQKIDAVNGRTAAELCATQTQSMGRHAVSVLRRAFVEAWQRGHVEGWTADELHREIQARWDDAAGDEGSFRFVDRGGRAWSNAQYLQMLTRTTMNKVTRNQFCATMAGNGVDVARVSADGGGGDDCEACSRWEGRLVSITGATKGLPTLAEAEADGLFHPNCVHRLEYVDEDELPELMRQQGAGEQEEQEEEAQETDEERAARERAEAEELERKTLASSILGKMPDGFSAGREDVFNGTPMYVLRKFDQSVAHFAEARGGANCDTTTGTVNIAKDPNSWSGCRDTVHHECGHAALGKAGLSTWLRVAPIPDKFKPIFEAAKRETENAAVEKFGKTWKSSARGLDYADVAEKFLGIPRSDFLSMTFPQQHEVAALSDLMEAATKGNQFSGHGKSYYRRQGECGALHEVVAEVTGLISGKYADKARAMFPDTFRLVEETVYGHKPQS